MRQSGQTTEGAGNPYDVLSVAPGAPDFVIRAAYRACMKRYHPDHDHSIDAAARTQQVMDAFAVLNDPRKRARLDRQLAAGARQGPDIAEVQRWPWTWTMPPRDTWPFIGIAVLAGSSALLLLLAANFGGSAAEPDPETRLAEIFPEAERGGGTAGTAPAADQAAGPVEESAATAANSPVNFSNVENGSRRFIAIWNADGMAGARAFSERCHRESENSLSWDRLDYCAAFDMAARMMDQSAGELLSRAADPYFKYQADYQSEYYNGGRDQTYSRLEKIRTVANSIVSEEVQRQMRLAAEERAKAQAAGEDATLGPNSQGLMTTLPAPGRY